MVVTISNPRLEGQNLTYEVKTLEGDLPKTGGAAALFIDVIIARRASDGPSGYAQTTGAALSRAQAAVHGLLLLEAGHAAKVRRREKEYRAANAS